MPSPDQKFSRHPLFGGEASWKSEDWTNSDDRVRGGSSKSALDCHKLQATFKGTLDIKTLGGAGFASQRTTGEDRTWDLCDFDGIELSLNAKHSDQKRYTLILKDKLLPKDPDNGREQSTISWEYAFVIPTQEAPSKDSQTALFIPWSGFTATYRGKECKDAEKLNLTNIKRFSIMMRSFFGTQEGEFKLTLVSITARKDAIAYDATPSDHPQPESATSADEESISGGSLVKQELRQSSERSSIWRWLLWKCGKL